MLDFSKVLYQSCCAVGYLETAVKIEWWVPTLPRSPACPLFFFSTHRWVKFGMNWSRSWAASLWDLAICQLHHCHLQMETSFPINTPSTYREQEVQSREGSDLYLQMLEWILQTAFFFLFKYCCFELLSDLDRLDVGQNTHKKVVLILECSRAELTFVILQTVFVGSGCGMVQ